MITNYNKGPMSCSYIKMYIHARKLAWRRTMYELLHFIIFTKLLGIHFRLEICAHADVQHKH